MTELQFDSSDSTEPTSSLDYKVWAFGFFGVRDMFTTPNNEIRWGSITYPYPSLVPMVKVSSNVYNGYRLPGDIDSNSEIASPNLTFNASFSIFKDRLLSIPEGRRSVCLYYWFTDISIYTHAHYEYYKNTNDGTIFNPPPANGVPQGDRILTPWLDTNLEDNKNSVRQFLEKCKDEQLFFDFFIDDKESQDIFWLNGRNTSLGKYWGPPIDGSIYPTNPCRWAPLKTPPEPRASHCEGLDEVSDLSPQMPDARWIRAITSDPRFTEKINPRTQMTFAEEFMETYKLIANKPNETRTWQEILAPFINLSRSTIPTGYITPSNFWIPYALSPGKWWAPNASLNPGPTGNNLVPSEWWPQEIPIPDGYDLFHHVTPAWNATADSWHFNYYIDEAFLKICKEYPEFENVKFSQYEVSPIDHEDAKYKLTSNGYPYMLNSIPEWYVGASIDYYCGIQNIVYIGGLNFYPNGSQNRSIWLNNHSYRTGYVNNPQSDREKYAWNGFYVKKYNGEAGTKNLVKYPESNPYEEEVYSVIKENKFYEELCFKFLVNGVMRTRFGLRADPTMWQRFAPWITTPTYYDGPFNKGNSSGYPYWFEIVYHLCVSGVRFFNLFSDEYNQEVAPVNEALDEWKKISNNSRAIPCSNSTGDINLPIDRLILHEVFNKGLLSGGKLEDSDLYLWRLTIPPKYFNSRGICKLKRVGNDSDISEFITIDSKNLKNSRGVWILREMSTPPSYIPIKNENLNRTNKNDIVRIFQTNDNLAYKKQESIIIQKTVPNKILVRL